MTTSTSNITFSTKSIDAAGHSATLFEIEIPSGVCEPADLAKIVVPNIPGDRGVVISGRAPIWLFCFLAHHFHVCQWVSTFDPRLNGAVVVSRHSKDAPQIGEVLNLPKSE